MATFRAIAGLTLAAASAACGELASRDYQPPPIAAIHGELALTATDLDGSAVRVFLVWQPAGWTTEPGDVFLEANPQVTGLPLSCGRHGRACGWYGTRSCTASHGLAELVATLSVPVSGTMEFEAPIYALPPAAAFSDLGGSRVAFGYLLFLAGPGGAGGPDGSPVASSAHNGPTRSFSSPYRTSYLVAYREGEAPVPACGTTCGDPSSPPPETNPGLLGRLPAGFSLVLKLEKDDGEGRLVPHALTYVPLGTRIAVSGHATGEGGAWCPETVVRETWGPHPRSAPPSSSTWDRCSSTAAEFACVGQDGCGVTIELHERCEAAPPTTCVPGPGDADDVSLRQIPHREFHRLPSGAVLGLGAIDATDRESDWTFASLYDPLARDWWQTRETPDFWRRGEAFADLPSGRVLVTGGSPDDDDARSAELFDPATGAWTRALSMRTPRTGHTATTLRSGKVLVLGGRNTTEPDGTWSAELFDPVEGTWLPFGLGMDGPPLADHTALLLPGPASTVFVTDPGGGPGTFLCAPSSTSPRADCRAAGAMSAAHRDGTFTVLPTGKVLALGGRAAPASAEVFDPATGLWTPAAPMPHERASHAAVALPSGLVVAAGGEAEDGSPRVEVDVYDPARDRWEPSDPLTYPRASFAMFASASEVLVVGGPRVAIIYAPPAERLCVAPP